MTGVRLGGGRLTTSPEQEVQPSGRRRVPLASQLGDDQFGRVEGNGPDLDLFRRAGREEVAAFDPGQQVGVVAEDAVQPQDVGDEVVGEDGQAV